MINRWLTKVFRPLLAPTLVFSLVPSTPAQAETIRSAASPLDGVGGVGNTTDITIQLELAKEAGLHILKNVSAVDLFASSGRRETSELYRACRDAMYRGAVGTQFRIVNVIPDGDGFHALAHRASPTEIQISRTEMDKLLANGTLSSSLLVMVFLHEVTHDCVREDARVSDSEDPLINRMTIELYKASRKISDGSFRDLEFVTKVQEEKTVRFEDLSPQSRQAIATAYINYVGDWLYNRYKDRFRYRPAPASDFYANEETSVFPGWSELRKAVSSTTPEMETIVFGVMRATFEEKDLAYYAGMDRRSLPTQTGCVIDRNKEENFAFANCQILISWAPMPSANVHRFKQRIQFQLDSLGRIHIRKVAFY